MLLAVLFLHLRLTMPWLFGGFFSQFWPLILLGIAFLGVGLSELFRRQGRMVLAEPLERTGVLLPVLPLASGLWSTPQPGQDVVFFILVGGLYTLLSVLRSSLVFASLAGLAFNGALWSLLSHAEGLGLLRHPQLWVIPPALCVLVGAYWNRDRLSEAQLAAIRYGTAIVMYVSSLGDIVLTGVAQAPWLPVSAGPPGDRGHPRRHLAPACAGSCSWAWARSAWRSSRSSGTPRWTSTRAGSGGLAASPPASSS